MHSQTATSPSSRNADIYDLLSRANPNILTIAHRGLWSAAPENSLAAIRAAAELGVEFVEIDTQATADGHLVVIHDKTLDRTTSAKGIVGASSFAAVRDARLRGGAGGELAALTDERVPTLEEALEEARGRVFVNIDTKFPANCHRSLLQCGGWVRKITSSSNRMSRRKVAAFRCWTPIGSAQSRICRCFPSGPENSPRTSG